MPEDTQIKVVRSFLKMKLIEDNFTFRGHLEQKRHLYDLLSKTVESGESNSAIVVGPRGAGKTTLMNNVLHQLFSNLNFKDNSILVKLNGNVHIDDRTALKAITTQMSLDNVIGDKVFGSFSENLAFLLSCLKSGQDKKCKSVLFILEEFDLFCHTHGSQTLLYNLFDIAQSKQAPICVIGITCRLDVVELLEKRVKSRFSHRQIFIFPNEVINNTPDSNEESVEKRFKLFCNLLSLPDEMKQTKKKNVSKLLNFSKVSIHEVENESVSDISIPDIVLTKCKRSWKDFQKLDPTFVKSWNENIQYLSQNKDVKNCLHKLYDLDVTDECLKQFLIPIVANLSDNHPQIEVSDIVNETESRCGVDDRVSLLLSLSVLEMSLIIAMKHQTEIFADQPMNFEMIYNRYIKFAACNSSSQTVPKAVVLKAFEHLKSLQLIAPVKDAGLSGGYIQKEFQFYQLLIANSEISEAINSFKALPTELIQWAASSLI